MEGWKNFGPTALLCRCLLLITYIFLHVNIQTGGGEGVEDGVIAKSLLQKTDKTPNPREDKGDREGIPHTHPIP